MLNMYGGSYSIDNKYLEILNKYQMIPDSGLFVPISNSKEITTAINKFKIFCEYILNITKDEKIYQYRQEHFFTILKINKDPVIVEIKRELGILKKISIDKLSNIILQNKNLKFKKAYDLILKKYNYQEIEKKLHQEIKMMGKHYMKIGHDFEKNISSQIIPSISKILKISPNKLRLLENSELKLISNNKEVLIGEIDIIILKDNKIIAVGEIKKSLDDISDALFQINRTFKTIKQDKSVFLEFNGIKMRNIFEYIRNLNEDQLLERSFIFTEYDSNKKYKKIPSKLSLFILEILWRGNIKNINDKFYKKLFFKIKKKQKKRYNTNVENTLDLFYKKNLVDRIQLSDNL